MFSPTCHLVSVIRTRHNETQAATLHRRSTMRSRSSLSRLIVRTVCCALIGFVLIIGTKHRLEITRYDQQSTRVSRDDNGNIVLRLVDHVTREVSLQRRTDTPRAEIRNSSCIYTWTAFGDRHVAGGRLHVATSVVDCQSACVNDTRCVGVDFNSDRQCFVLLSDDALIQTEEIGCVHYDLYRTCGDDVDDDSLAQSLYESVRVLCWVMTTPANHKTKAIHVQATWGRRCNILLFVSEKNDLAALPVVLVDVQTGRQHLTQKSLSAFEYVYNHYRNDADWFLKADDDTYVIIENLRYFLSTKDTTQPVYFGQHFKYARYVKQGYLSGGAGYTLSREALTRLAKRSVECREKSGVEDLEIGQCMERLGIQVGDSRDARGRDRFNCFPPNVVISGNYPVWYRHYDVHGAKKGIEAMSDYAISFHFISSLEFYSFEFFTYHLRPFGILPRMTHKTDKL